MVTLANLQPGHCSIGNDPRNNQFFGVIDDMRMYSSALTQSELQTLLNLGRGVTTQTTQAGTGATSSQTTAKGLTTASQTTAKGSSTSSQSGSSTSSQSGSSTSSQSGSSTSSQSGSGTTDISGTTALDNLKSSANALETCLFIFVFVCALLI